MRLPQAKSLRKTLIIYTSIFSVIMGCALIVSAYLVAFEETDEILDAQMRYMAEMTASGSLVSKANHFQLGKKYHEEDLFIDVWAYAEKTNQQDPFHLLFGPLQKAGFYERKTVIGEWHTYVLPLKDYQIQVSQQVSVRQSLALELATSIFFPYIILIILVISGLSWIIARSLQPLEDFKLELAQREPQDLHQIESQPYPLEIIPTIDEMNRLFAKISLAQLEQKQFIADATHELRTPITALNLQSKILLKNFPNSKELQNLNQGLIRIQHLVAQLLSLAKQDASLPYLEQLKSFSLNQVTLACIEQLIPFALQKNIDLGVAEQDVIDLNSDESAVYSIIYNLIDNAIKYSPKNGMINISLLKLNQHIVIKVEDSGAGVDPQQYEHILKRFYRVHNHAEIGSGLGLSIVNKATQRLGGQLIFSQSASLGGLQVNVELPMHIMSDTAYKT